MGVKLASSCLNWSQQSSNYFPPSSSPQTLASAIYVHRPAIFGTKLNSYRSFENLKTSRERRSIKSIVTASLDAEFSDEEFCREIQELALVFDLSDDDESNRNTAKNPDLIISESKTLEFQSPSSKMGDMEVPDWARDMIPASIERKANSVDLPISLRIIQRKKQWREGFREAGESAYCSVKKAFSSMVFIIRELQSYTLQMREALFYEDLTGVLVRVQTEMNASFVWLFQQVFSHTPTLMVYVMILLANYSVFAVSSNASAFAAASAAPPPAAAVEYVSSLENQIRTGIDSSSMKTFPVNLSGKTMSIGGINGGGGKSRPVASDTDGGESFDGVNPSVSGQAIEEEESGLWKSVMEEADRMQQDVMRYGVLDRETMGRFVSPVTAKVVEEDAAVEGHSRTELLYQMGLSDEPDNPLLLANYAQFLYIVVQDYDRYTSLTL